MDILPYMEYMGKSDVPVIAAFFIGLMLTISPCAMTTNLTAIAYVSRRMEGSKHTLLVGLLYTLGRVISYVLLASLIVGIGLSTQSISFFLQDYGARIIGPFLIILGVLMLDLGKIGLLKGSERIGRLQKALAEKGYLGSFLLGALFALAFCPFSAVLFFGMLIPLCLKSGDGIVLPIVFATATGLPVILFSILLVYGASRIGELMNCLNVFERWFTRIAAFVFITAGAYLAFGGVL